MSASLLPRLWAVMLCAGGLAFVCVTAHAHESPIDHVERELDLSVKDDQLLLRYRLRYSERALLLQIHQMDGNADGELSASETAAFFTAHAAMLAALFTVQVEGRAVKFQPVGAMRPDARLGQTYEFSAPLGNLAAGRHPGSFLDGYSRIYPGAFRWRRPGEGSPRATRVEPLIPPEAARSSPQQHPAWLELKFEIVVPQ